MTARHFEMWRDRDISGVSGEGLIAEGWQYDVPYQVTLPDGSVLDLASGWCLIYWRGKHRSAVFWPSFEDAEAVHGHGGATRFVWTGRELPAAAARQYSVEFHGSAFTPNQLRELRG